MASSSNTEEAIRTIFTEGIAKGEKVELHDIEGLTTKQVTFNGTVLGMVREFRSNPGTYHFANYDRVLDTLVRQGPLETMAEAIEKQIRLLA